MQDQRRQKDWPHNSKGYEHSLPCLLTHAVSVDPSSLFVVICRSQNCSNVQLAERLVKARIQEIRSAASSGGGFGGGGGKHVIAGVVSLDY